MSSKSYSLDEKTQNSLYKIVKNVTKVTNTTKEISKSTSHYWIPDGTVMFYVALWFLGAIIMGLLYLHCRDKRAPATRAERVLQNHKNLQDRPPTSISKFSPNASPPAAYEKL